MYLILQFYIEHGNVKDSLIEWREAICEVESPFGLIMNNTFICYCVPKYLTSMYYEGVYCNYDFSAYNYFILCVMVSLFFFAAVIFSRNKLAQRA